MQNRSGTIRNEDFASVSTSTTVDVDAQSFDVWVGITGRGGICTRVYSRKTGDLLYECWNDVRADGSTSGKNCIENNCK